ncbi:ECF transporter S component [Latilactobacillus sakei]|uniref:ECF transporter S component n=1 Tax=Latilactobacillus sakei TaxID=1599 RepID=UPI000DC6432D|nr:ECF transporter S component [Latilactobacillus sakei]SPS03235.1 Pantothenate transporter PanT [Latilactobacillus sakei]
MTRNSSAYKISILAILTALLMIQSFVPMVGYIYILPGLPGVTTMHLTVIIGAIILGTRGGATLGAIWGTLSLIHAYTAPFDALTLLIFQNPVIAILPRLMVGLVAGLLYQHLHNTKAGQRGSMAIAAFFGTIVNTTLVILLTWAFYSQQAAGIYKTDVSHLIIVMLSAVAINALMEIALAVIVTPFVAKPLLRFKRE